MMEYLVKVSGIGILHRIASPNADEKQASSMPAGVRILEDGREGRRGKIRDEEKGAYQNGILQRRIAG